MMPIVAALRRTDGSRMIGCGVLFLELWIAAAVFVSANFVPVCKRHVQFIERLACVLVTQVHKLGSVGRSIDVQKFQNYSELRSELARLFNLEGLLDDPQRSGWQLVFVDNENDTLLVGDDPWE